MRAFPKCPRCGVFHAEIKLKTSHLLNIVGDTPANSRVAIGGISMIEEFTENTETHCIACDSTFPWKAFREEKMSDLPLSMAFRITSEDVVTVFNSRDGVTIDDKEAERLFDLLDQDLVAVEACKGGTDMDDQLEAAYDEIERQLDELGELN